ncbi:DUF998 domain-containing protein [Saccharomonospora sp. NPDC006951]
MAELRTKTASTTTAARTRTWTIVASASLGWALFTLTILHAISSFNPLTDPLSRYAFSDHGTGMLEASLLSFALAVVAVRGALASAGIGISRTTSVLVGATALGLVAAALFPATFTEDINPVSGKIHQYASVIAFASLPAIAFSLLDALRGSPALAASRQMLVRLLQVSLVGLGLFGVSYVFDSVPGVPVFSLLASTLPVGFTQRIVFISYFCLLAALLVVAARAARLRLTSPR